MARLIDLAVTKVTWATTVSVVTAPTAAELNAGKDLGPYLTTNYKISMADSDTVSEKSIVETAQIDVPTIQKYAGQLELFRDFTAGAPTAVVDFSSFFAGANEAGFLVRRTGLPSTTAYIAAQIVEIYKFVADPPQFAAGTGSGYVKGTVKLLPQGVFGLKTAVV